MLRAFVFPLTDIPTLTKLHYLMQEQVHAIWNKEIAFWIKKSTSEYMIHSHLDNYQVKNRNRYILENWNLLYRFYFIWLLYWEIDLFFVVARWLLYKEFLINATLVRHQTLCPAQGYFPHRTLWICTLFLLKDIMKCNFHVHLFDVMNIPVFLNCIIYFTSWPKQCMPSFACLSCSVISNSSLVTPSL